jgi:methionyl-tRNA formyltransferase
VLADRTVACGTGSLEIQLIQPAGKKAMELQAFANGYGFGPGARLRSVVRNPG